MGGIVITKNNLVIHEIEKLKNLLEEDKINKETLFLEESKYEYPHRKINAIQLEFISQAEELLTEKNKGKYAIIHGISSVAINKVSLINERNLIYWEIC